MNLPLDGKERKIIKRGFRRWLKIFGPGLITGAADDDPSGIATYTQTGAQFGYGQLWTILFSYPLMTAIQEASARIGAVTGRGIASVIRKYYSKPLLYGVASLIFFANVINIGADIGAMAAATRLIIPIPFVVVSIFFAVAMLLIEIFTSYPVYASVLKWLALTLLAYPFTAFIVTQPWGEIAKATVIPHIEWNFDFLYIIVGVLGTTISPYMFFWQASEVVEEELEAKRMVRQDATPHRIGKQFIKNLQVDNALGMLISQMTTWFIIVVAGTVLHRHGITNVNSAADAAKAIEPLVKNFPNAGFIAKLIFSTGIVGLGLLSVPVLAGSASYALSEAFHWKEGLYRKLHQAPGFYGIIIVSMLLGLLMNFIGIDPVKALVFTSVLNGLVAVPLIFVIAKIAQNKKIMGEHVSGKLSKFFIWTTWVVMLLASIAVIVSLVHH